MKKLPKDYFVSIVPMWLRIGAIAAAGVATIYVVISDLQPYRAVSMTFNSLNLGWLVTAIVFLSPVLVAIYTLAFVLRLRRKRQDFPRARVHKG